MIRIKKDSEDQPSIRDSNLKVSDVLRWLGSGQTEKQIIEDHPGLDREDCLAVYQYAASQIDEPWERIRNDIKEKFDSVSRDQCERNKLLW